MKAKYAVIVLTLGLCLDFVGVVFKLLHWVGSDWLLLTGLTFKVVGALTFLYKLLTHPKVREFLNW
jgi:protein-S-isoprenylcysteine O-methyltransferase Ste14